MVTLMSLSTVLFLYEILVVGVALGHVGFIKLNAKCWPPILSLVLNRKLQRWCRSKDNTNSQIQIVKRKIWFYFGLNEYRKLIKLSIIFLVHKIDFYKLRKTFGVT